MLDFRDIIIVSVARWGYNPFLPHHMAMQLSRTKRVVWINQGFFFSDIISHPGQLQIKVADAAIKNWLKRHKVINENLFIYYPCPLLLTPGYSDVNDKITHLVISKGIKNYLRKLSFSHPIVWVYQPYYLDAAQFKNEVGGKLICYECIDDFTSLTNFDRKKGKIKIREQKLLQSSDLVITSSLPLFKENRKYNDDTYYLPPGVDFDHYSKAADSSTKIPDDIAKIARPIIGYIGSLGKIKIDWNLIEMVCDHNWKGSVVMVGPTFDHPPPYLSSLRNLYFIGSKPVGILPNYLKSFDVCIIPFNMNRFSQNAFPTKTFEYLAAGKSVISTNIPSLRKFQPIIKVANSRKEFIGFIEESLENNDNEQERERIALARKYSWEKRAEKAISLVNKALLFKSPGHF